MATAIQYDSGPTLVPNPHPNVYPRPLSIAELEYKDNRYQPLAPPMQTSRHTSAMVYSSGPAPWDNPGDQQRRQDQYTQWIPSTNQSDVGVFGADGVANGQQQSRNPGQDDTVTYTLPPGAARRVIERYSLEESIPPDPYSSPNTHGSGAVETNVQIQHAPSPPPQTSQMPRPTNGRSSPLPATSLDVRYLPIPPQLTGAASTATSSSSPTFSPAPPFVTTPQYNQSIGIPVSPKPRAYAQQPVYITPSSAPNPVKPVYSPPPQEEVCLECAMRDQDMADVDVASPGVWDRDSDVLYEDLVRREREERASGIVNTDPTRPRAIGGRLTETNLKIWLSVVSFCFWVNDILLNTLSERTLENLHHGSRRWRSISGRKEDCLKRK
jgi:hypothetical protein